MELNFILEKFEASAQVNSLAGNLLDNKKVFLNGASSSASAFILSAWYNKSPQPVVVIMPDREDAAYFFNDIENIIGEKHVMFFPSSYKKPYKLDGIDNTNVLMRAEVLSRISKNTDAFIIVTSPDALHERVITKKNLAKNTIEAKVGDSISIDFITEFLVDSGFERCDFVYEPGQFSIRGGIVDIYSFAHELPYRLEFGGNKIESIRSFDPNSQLSEKNMHFITIIPNVQTQLASQGTESFFSFIPQKTIFWARDFEYTIQVIEKHLNEVPTDNSDEWTNSEGIKVQSAAEVFETADEVKNRLQNFSAVEFGLKSFYADAEIILFNQIPQPSFNKNFHLLAENFLDNSSKNFSNFIFSDSVKQIERIYAIFDDINFKSQQHDRDIKFFPIYTSLHKGFVDYDLKLACYTDHQIFDRYHRFRLRKNYSRSEAITLKELYSLKPGDFVTHIDHGVGRFGGLEKMDVNGVQQEAIRLVYKDNDILYISIHSLHRIARFSGKDGAQPSLNKLGSTAWATLKQKTKKRVKDIAKDLIALYAKRKSQQGFAFAPDTYMQNELEASFIYEDTPDQVKATRDVKKDMESSAPMDRLVCGDVGFGKTEIAVRAAFKAVSDGKQVAILVPTTILALQHYRTFQERLKDFPCTIDYINRFKSSAEQTETIKKIAEGKIDIIIGTHRLLSKDIKYKDLGLLIIDEEQKFGVASKEKIKAVKINVDTLTLTATPIPRTLHFSLMGARDLSIINTAPPNRYPVTTEVHVFNEKIIREAINYEVSRGGQVFFVHNRVQDIHDMAAMIRKLCPTVKITVGHGQMEGHQLEAVMLEFINGDADVLISTTIIESGLDISNANTIIINQAQNFGLSDLHQMRGRVGRSNKKAFCYLLAPPPTVLTPEARQRLRAIEEYSELGMGFQVSMRDLDIRGAGNLLGGEQSGFISEIGFETYHKILDEAIAELRETDFKDLFPVDETKPFVSDCQIETDLAILIPDAYVENIVERLNLYKDLDDIETEEKLNDFETHMRDRFGPIPKQVFELFETIRLRWKAKELGIEKLILKHNALKAYLVSNPASHLYNSAVFTQIINYVKTHPQNCKLREDKSKLSITFSNIKSIKDANNVLEKITKTVEVAQQ